MKVLVAEDDAISRRLLELSLRRWGYEPVLAADGAEALTLLDEHDAPIVVSDWMMPVVDGVELVRRIRLRERDAYVYVILLTARTSTDDLVEAMDAGADDYLTKPFNDEELRVRVRAGERVVLLERRLAEQNRALRDAQAALVQSEKLASLGQLAAGVAHEINNPLAYVNNYVAVVRREVEGLVREGRLGEDLPRHLQSCTDGLRRVRDIVRNMLDFARLDEAEVKEADLNDAVRSTVEMLRHEMKERDVSLDLELGDLPAVVCRPGKVNQVLLNLLMNAIQVSRAVTVRTVAMAGAVAIEVQDAGPGIADEHLPKIFDPFFTTKPVGQGTGLGLSVSYGIVREHGGTIEVETEPGRGALFRVRLPLRAVR